MLEYVGNTKPNPTTSNNFQHYFQHLFLLILFIITILLLVGYVGNKKRLSNNFFTYSLKKTKMAIDRPCLFPHFPYQGLQGIR